MGARHRLIDWTSSKSIGLLPIPPGQQFQRLMADHGITLFDEPVG